jgi:hypothetical protein
VASSSRNADRHESAGPTGNEESPNWANARAPNCLHPCEVEIALRLAANDVVGRRIPYRIGRGPNDSKVRFAAAKIYATRP